jgi:exodeoxyribonuclease-3
MKIVTYNVNGIRSALTKGFADWLATHPADVVCLQEVKALEKDVDLKQFTDLGYSVYWFAAQKKGYSGVAVLSKIQPDLVTQGCGIEQSDAEGRVLQLDFGKVRLINAYFPSGTTGDIRQTYKYQWLDEFFDYMQEARKQGKSLIVCGDYNIAHNEIDIHDPKGNKKSSGFLPEERAWMDKLLAAGFVDTFRLLNDTPGQYSWWSQRFPTVRLQNKGWRIDYINVTDDLKDKVKDVAIWPDVKHSDHCPVYLELAL